MLAVNAKLYEGKLLIDSTSSFDYSIRVANTLINVSPGIEFSTINLVISLIVNALISFVALLSFKKRPLQLSLVRFNFLGLLVSLFFIIYNYFQLLNLKNVSIVSTEWQWTLILPLLLIVLNVLAFSGIKKDIELVASVDRLR